MATRVVSALVGAALFLAVTAAGGLWFVGAVTLLAVLGLREWATAYNRPPAAPSAPGSAWSRAAPLLNWLWVALGVALPFRAHHAALRDPGLLPLFAVLMALVVALCCVGVARFAKSGQALGRFRAVWGLAGCLYIGLLFSSFVLVRGMSERGGWLLLMVAVCVWATDSLAYFTGRKFGKRKLAPSLSPNKTVEGSLGGLIGALVAGGVFAACAGFPVWHGLIVGALAGTMGQVGDLWESALKRELGVKDFGAVMPGHGGALDRFDSLLFVTPLAYAFLAFFAR